MVFTLRGLAVEPRADLTPFHECSTVPIQAANEGADPDRDGAFGIVLFAASGSDLLGLLKKTVKKGRSGATMRHYLLDELNERGWRFRFCGRQIEVIRKGREESRAAANT